MKHDFMWGELLHLSTNLWYEDDGIGHGEHKNLWEIPASNELRLDKKVWDDHIDHLKRAGANTLIIDLGDGVVYDSHPEIAVKGAWTKQYLLDEIKRLEDMGFEVLPKLNFSTTHDYWLKEYAKMVSTPTYYKVCKDLIDEVCEMFNKPRYFHIGMDEESYEMQAHYNYVVIRQNDLWWSDLYKIISWVEANGARPIMWTDYMRHKPEEFVQKCPKSVIACNWYYFNEFGDNISPENEIRVKPFKILEEHGFDQIPGGNAHYFKDNLDLLTKYCSENISKEHLLGFLQTSWSMMTDPWRDELSDCAEAIERSKKQLM